MSPNKTVLLCVFAMSSAVSFAQQTDTLTLDEYTKILAAKMKQTDLASTSTMPAKALRNSEEHKPRKVAPIDPFAGWSYNGATIEAATKQPLFGELIFGGRSSIVYSGDVIGQVWRVVLLSEQNIEFENVMCAAPGAQKKAIHPGVCQHRLTRRS
jgi:hypothetical protein